MCGICGFFQAAPILPDAEDLVVAMRDEMVHRGPDGCGVRVGRNYALGHRRLKIVDLSEHARQPMSNEDGSVWVTFNGEIYNHLDIRPELEARGHQFRSRSDTEVIVHGWEEWGEAWWTGSPACSPSPSPTSGAIATSSRGIESESNRFSISGATACWFLLQRSSRCCATRIVPAA